VGEYILAIYGQVREKPIVFERERINFPDSGSAPVESRQKETAIVRSAE
jgi:hypothetical protein